MGNLHSKFITQGGRHHAMHCARAAEHTSLVQKFAAGWAPWASDAVASRFWGDASRARKPSASDGAGATPEPGSAAAPGAGRTHETAATRKSRERILLTIPDSSFSKN